MPKPKKKETEEEQEIRLNLLKKLQYVKCFTKKGCHLKYFNENEMTYLQTAIMKSTKDADYLSHFYNITKLEYERFYFKNELQLPIMHLYTDYLQTLADQTRYKTFLFFLFDVTSYDPLTEEIEVSVRSDWPKGFKEGEVKHRELERIYMQFLYKNIFHLIIIETTGKQRAIYPNYMLKLLKIIENEEILSIASNIIENYLGYSFEKIKIVNQIQEYIWSDCGLYNLAYISDSKEIIDIDQTKVEKKTMDYIQKRLSWLILKLMVVRTHVDVFKTEELEEREFKEHEIINEQWKESAVEEHKPFFKFLVPKQAQRRYFQGIKIEQNVKNQREGGKQGHYVLKANPVSHDFLYAHREKPKKTTKVHQKTDLNSMRKKTYPFGFPKQSTKQINNPRPAIRGFYSVRKDPFYKVAMPVRPKIESCQSERQVTAPMEFRSQDIKQEVKKENVPRIVNLHQMKLRRNPEITPSQRTVKTILQRFTSQLKAKLATKEEQRAYNFMHMELGYPQNKHYYKINEKRFQKLILDFEEQVFVQIKLEYLKAQRADIQSYFDNLKHFESRFWKSEKGKSIIQKLLSHYYKNDIMNFLYILKKFGRNILTETEYNSVKQEAALKAKDFLMKLDDQETREILRGNHFQQREEIVDKMKSQKLNEIDSTIKELQAYKGGYILSKKKKENNTEKP